MYSQTENISQDEYFAHAFGIDMAPVLLEG